jgi:hypothetical protein
VFGDGEEFPIRPPPGQRRSQGCQIQAVLFVYQKDNPRKQKKRLKAGFISVEILGAI